jgi:hypothetical protein
MIVLPPPVTDIPYDREGSKCQVEDAGIHAFGRFFTQLLGGFGANGTLSGNPLAE